MVPRHWDTVVKLKHFEFWNTHLFHLPVYLYWLYLSFRARSPFFFSAANPGIETGGLLGESKYRILEKIDKRYLPTTLYYENVPTVEQLLKELAREKITFPFVVKPDIGQGGWMVDMILDRQDLDRFLAKIKMPFMVQEYVDDPLELGVLYYRLPHEPRGRISSLAIKELLSVTGNGKDSVQALLALNPRARHSLQKLSPGKKISLHHVPSKGKTIQVSFIANHSYGTKFLNGNDQIDEQITQLFDTLSKNISGFYFGRFDIRCESMEALKKGEFRILELNGVGSEPLHIFDPTEKLRRAYRTAFLHWKAIYRISMINMKAGIACMTWREAWRIYKMVSAIQRIHKTNFTIGN